MTWQQHLLVAAINILGLFLILASWVSIQSLVRRRSGCKNPDKDVLEFMLHGCGGGCSNKGQCHTPHSQESHPV